jgi:hypothetical protein
MRFTIRDLLWLTAVVALGVGWWRDHAFRSKCLDVLREHAELLKPLDDDVFGPYGVVTTIRVRPIPPGCGASGGTISGSASRTPGSKSY